VHDCHRHRKIEMGKKERGRDKGHSQNSNKGGTYPRLLSEGEKKTEKGWCGGGVGGGGGWGVGGGGFG